MTYTQWLYALAPFAIPLGVLLGWLTSRGNHFRQCCPSTAWPKVPETCTCRCKACRSGQHPRKEGT